NNLDKLFFTITTSEDSIAMEEPLPIAIPIFAFASAGASLIPSPIIPTTFPFSWLPFTYFIYPQVNKQQHTDRYPPHQQLFLQPFRYLPLAKPHGFLHLENQLPLWSIRFELDRQGRNSQLSHYIYRQK